MAAPCTTGAPRRLAVCALVAITLATPSAQVAQIASTPSSAPAMLPVAATAAREDEQNTVQLLVGRSTILNVGSTITRVSLTKPEIADAMVTSTQQVLVHGKSPGAISLLVWERGGAIRRYEVVVQRDLSRLIQQLQQLFPGESIAATESGKDVVIAGTVSSKYIVDKAGEVAAGYVDKKEDLVNLLRLQEGIASNQVLLRVRFAEVSRSALQELGASLFTGATGYKDYIGRSSTEQFAAPGYEDLARTETNGSVTTLEGKTVFSDFLNLFIFNTQYNIGALVRALQLRGLFQSLAEPNLIADNGKEASFLAGGEYPYPAVQGSGAALSVTIAFKEFGVRLNFTPTVQPGDLVHLKVRPEVSSLDFNNAVTLQGFRVPSLITRRAETEVELLDGQTFAIAGLMNNTLTSTMQKIPGIGDIPILGLLFKSKAAQKAQTELVVMITPQILKRTSTGAAPALPNMPEPFLPPLPKPIPPPPPHAPSAAKQQRADAKRAAEQAEADEKRLAAQRARAEEVAKDERTKAEKAAREQAKRDEAAARERAKQQAKEAQVAAREAKKRVEVERVKGKKRLEAEQRLKSALDAYQEALDRAKKRAVPPPQ